MEMRVYRGDEAASAAAQPITLETVFETYMKPEMEALGRDNNIGKYKNSLSRFAVFCGLVGNTISIPDITQISDLMLLQWQRHEVKLGRAPTTINVDWTRIKAVLHRAKELPPDGPGVITRVPKLKPLAVPKSRPKLVPISRIDALYRYGSPDMAWPGYSDGIPTAHRWQAWIVLAYNLGYRTRDLLGLRWSNVHWQAASLDPESACENPWGWVAIVPEKTDESKPDELILPLSETARTHLQLIRYDGKYVFGDEMATVSDDDLYGRSDRPGSGHWTQLCQMAAFHVDGGLDRFEINHFRKTCRSAFNRIHPKLGDYFLGHAARGVGETYYQQYEPDAIDAVAKLPQPPSFTRAPSEPLRQALLF